MLATALILVPVGLVLGLLAFGEHGGPRLEPTPRAVGAVGLAALLAGPVAVAVLGLLVWLLCVALAVSLLTMAVAWHVPRQATSR